MRDKNPQNAKVGDLIMWTSNFGGFKFGKLIGFNRNGTPMVQPIGQPYVQRRRVVPGEKDWRDYAYGDSIHPETGKRGYWTDKYEVCEIQVPVHYSRGHEAGSTWTVIAYGDGRAETTTEEHPIAKARRQFMELEGKKGYAF